MKPKILLGTVAIVLTFAGATHLLHKSGVISQIHSNNFQHLTTNSWPETQSSESSTSQVPLDGTPAQVALIPDERYTLSEKAPLFTCYRALRMANAYLEQSDSSARQAGLAKLVKSGEMTWNPDVKREYTFNSCADGDCQYVILRQGSSQKIFYAYRESLQGTADKPAGNNLFSQSN